MPRCAEMFGDQAETSKLAFGVGFGTRNILMVKPYTCTRVSLHASSLWRVLKAEHVCWGKDLCAREATVLVFGMVIQDFQVFVKFFVNMI